MKIEASLFSNNQHRGIRHFEQPTSLDTKFHRAAIDGYVDMLCDASKRDTNLASEENGLTPTLLAAHHGQLEALRILVGRGGDPEKTGGAGLNALHLAAGRNHLNCVSFLVNFGVNMWALDNELRTAKDIAAIEQSKEVLDYLDQMMAKQSALNTKNVQKLKEKAKLASEKRLKQVRKAQLKAIKQVEKDERYLVKLSNNRRILKAAHSISDIKLVGRPEQAQSQQHPHNNNNYHHHHHNLQISYSPSDIHPLSSRSSVALADQSRLSSSPNFINYKLHSDLLSRPRQLKFRTNNCLSSSTCNSTTDESAYSSSSVSSTSGYLSAGGSTSALSMLAAKQSISARDSELRRPRYSDLVAVTNDQQLMANMKLRARSANKKQQSNEQQSLKSNSTIGNKLRSIGGVSRKVQLKRLLLVNSQSSNNIALDSASDDGQNLPIKNLIDEEGLAGGQVEPTTGNTGKLCNVQSTMKLKLVGSDQSQRLNNRAALSTGGQTTEQTANMIKWPPAPSLTRAISEPDFGFALRCSVEEQQQQQQQQQQPATSERESQREQVNFEGACADESSSSSSSSSSGSRTSDIDKPAESADEQLADAANHHQVPNTDDMSANEPTASTNQDESRHLLLTQCLSQLKMRHQAILKDQQNETSKEQLEPEPIRLITGSGSGGGGSSGAGRAIRMVEQQAILYGTSDELLQHQLSAGEFPLRPSIIKQQQQQQQQQQQLHAQPVANCQQRNQQVGFAGKSSTAVSVDSIGSAGSLAQRNSASSSSSSSRSSSSSSSFASTYSSSLDTSKVSQQNLSRLTIQKVGSIALGSCREEAPQQTQTERIAGAPLEDPNVTETIDAFLLANGLIELSEVFVREKIDLEALMLLSEEDLKSLDILLGPRRKLLKAIGIRRTSRQLPGRHLGPMFVMVDTPL